MKTKLLLLVSIVSFVAFTQVSYAGVVNLNDSHINAILGSSNNAQLAHFTLPDVKKTDAIVTSPTNVSAADNTNITDNTQGILATDSYHHGGGGGGDGAVDGKNIVYIGVGFVSILGALGSLLSFGSSLAGPTAPTVTTIPAIDLAYERGLSEHWGVGVRLTYQSVTVSTTGTIDDGPWPNSPYNNYSYTDKLVLSGIAAVATGSYHFHASDKVDPYIGLALGYTSIGISYSNNDPNAAYDGNTDVAPTLNFGGFTFGGFGGLRVYFTNNIGAWLDLGYIGVGSAVFNFGLAAKF
jgi:hypothetical protein